MDYFENIPDFDPDWMVEIEESERLAQKAVEEAELEPKREDYDNEKDWLDAIYQYDFEQAMVPLSTEEIKNLTERID